MVKNYRTAARAKNEHVCPHTLIHTHSHTHLLLTRTQGVCELKKQILVEQEKVRQANAACDRYVLAFVLFLVIDMLRAFVLFLAMHCYVAVVCFVLGHCHVVGVCFIFTMLSHTVCLYLGPT